MKKFLSLLLVVVLCLSFGSTALAKTRALSITDSAGNPVDWISFKLLPHDRFTREVDTVWVNPLDYEKDELYAAAEAAYPGKPVVELGGITMNGYDTRDDYIFDYFGPFTAKVQDSNVHRGDKVVLFIASEDSEIGIRRVRAYCVKNGSFSFRSSAAAYCVYVVLHRGSC